MRVIYKGQPAEVWVISKTGEQPDWVKKAFQSHYLTWNDNRLKILINGLNPSAKESLKLGVLGSIAGLFAGGLAGNNVYAMGELGDVLDITHARVITHDYFLKHYSLENQPF